MRNLETDENPDQMVATNKAVILQFGTAACAPCAAIRLKLDRWGREHPEVLMRYISVEDHPMIAAQRGILSAPTVCLYILGKKALQESGYFSLDEFLDRTEKYLSFI